jgi:hypothetical protein
MVAEGKQVPVEAFGGIYVVDENTKYKLLNTKYKIEKIKRQKAKD